MSMKSSIRSLCHNFPQSMMAKWCVFFGYFPLRALPLFNFLDTYGSVSPCSCTLSCYKYILLINFRIRINDSNSISFTSFSSLTGSWDGLWCQWTSRKCALKTVSTLESFLCINNILLHSTWCIHCISYSSFYYHVKF